MPRVEIDVAVKDQEAWKLLDRISGRVSDMTPVMKEIGEMVRGTASMKGRGSVFAEPGHNLSTHTLLQQSMHIHAERSRVAVGINSEEAGIRVFGTGEPGRAMFSAWVNSHIRYLKTGKRVQVKAHTRRVKLPLGDISGQPFSMVQEGDWEEIKQTLVGFLAGLKG